MIDDISNSLKAAANSLDTVVGSAVDPSDPMAVEQLGLTIDYLGFTRSRLDHLWARVLFTLKHQAQLGEAVVDLLTAESMPVADSLSVALADGQDMLNKKHPALTEMRSAAELLAAAVREAIRDANRGEAALADRLGRVVSQVSKPWIEMERVWYEPLGFDPAPEQLPTLDSVLSH